MQKEKRGGGGERREGGERGAGEGAGGGVPARADGAATAGKERPRDTDRKGE